MSEMRVGAEVVCVDAHDSEGLLRAGRIYRVSRYAEAASFPATVGLEGVEDGLVWTADRFVVVVRDGDDAPSCGAGADSCVEQPPTLWMEMEPGDRKPELVHRADGRVGVTLWLNPDGSPADDFVVCGTPTASITLAENVFAAMLGAFIGHECPEKPDFSLVTL